MKKSKKHQEMLKQFFISTQPSKTKSPGIVCVGYSPRGLIYDANGLEIIETLWANLRTGWAITHVLDEKGMAQVDPKNEDRIWTTKNRYPYPLKFVEYKK